MTLNDNDNNMDVSDIVKEINEKIDKAISTTSNIDKILFLETYRKFIIDRISGKMVKEN